MGASVIFAGNKVKTLKGTINLNNGADLISSTVDPTSTAVSALPGSLLLNTSNGKVYKKNDSGLTTNWTELGASTSVAIYDQSLQVVASGAGAGQINGPISANTPITLPNSKTYNSTELQVYLNGLRMAPTTDYAYTSSTQIAFTFSIQIDDIIRFYTDRTF